MADYDPMRHFLSCDWGTSNLRVRLVARESLEVLAEQAVGRGCKAVATDTTAGDQRAAAYRRALLDVVGRLEGAVGAELSTLPVVISGMASSSIGWRELPYAETPFSLDGTGLVTERLDVDGLGPVLLLSGVATGSDVMRGEETELIGLLNAPEMAEHQSDCIVILPGTHSKHIDVVSGAIDTFQTAMTGELYQLLVGHSVLRPAVVAGEGETARTRIHEDERQGFLDGLHVGLESPLPQALFAVRAYSLLKKWSPRRCDGMLSGILLAHELLAFDPEILADIPVIIAADKFMAIRYELAFTTLFQHGLNTGEIRPPIIVSGQALAAAAVRGHALALDRLDD